MKATLVQTIDGQLVSTEIGADADLIAAMEVRGYAFKRVNNNLHQRAELQGAPVFKGLTGPMWNGDGLRYEDLEAYRQLSM